MTIINQDNIKIFMEMYFYIFDNKIELINRLIDKDKHDWKFWNNFTQEYTEVEKGKVKNKNECDFNDFYYTINILDNNMIGFDIFQKESEFSYDPDHFIRRYILTIDEVLDIVGD